MKIKLVALLFGFFCILRMSGQFLNGPSQAPQNYEFSTGQVNGGGSLYAPTSTDDVWKVTIGSPTGGPAATKLPFTSLPGWASEVTNTAGWIGPAYNCYPNDPGNHGCLQNSQDVWYSVTFNLPVNPVLVLNWQVAADDDVLGIYVNNSNVNTPDFVPPPGNHTTFPFDFKWCKWQAGLNTISIRVKSAATTNPNNWCGLMVISWGYTPSSIAGSPTVCANTNSVTYSLNGQSPLGANNYQWTMNPAGWNGTSSQNTINPSFGTQPVVLQAYAYSSQGCISTNTLLVTPKQPTVGITTPSTSICPCTQIVLTATGAVTYSWSFPVPPPVATNNPLTRTPCVNTNYVVTGWDVNGCKHTSPPLQITMLPVPTVTASAQPAVICAGVANTLTAGGAVNYTWQPSPPGPTSPNWVVNLPLTNTAITVIGQAVNGCTNSAVVTLTAGQLIPITTPSVLVCNDINPCTTLQVSSPANYPVTFNWQAPLSGSQTTVAVCPPINTTTAYVVSATSNSGCANSASVSVTSQTCCPPADPAILFTPPTVPLCNLTLTNLAQFAYSLTPGNVQVPIPGTVTGSGVTTSGGMYHFNLGQTLAPGSYSVTFTYTTSPYGCPYSITKWLTILPNMWLQMGGQPVRCAYSPLGDTLSALPNFPLSPWNYPVFYNWSPGGQNTPSIVVTPTVNTTYTVTVSSANCVSSATLTVVMFNTCCPQSASFPIVQADSIMGGIGPTFTLGGQTIIDHDLVISNPGNTSVNFKFKAGDFLMGNNAKIIIRPNVVVILEDAHFYGCDQMWDGFVVQNGAGIISQIGPIGLSTLIEDAHNAIDVANINVGHQLGPIGLQDVIFNRNWMCISIHNSTLTSMIPIGITSCVFTNRDLPTGNLSWPSTSTISPGLRYAAPGLVANSLAPPFKFNNYPLKFPKVWSQGFPGGISVQDIGDTTGVSLPGPGVNMSAYMAPPAYLYNVFDFLQVPIYIKNASFTTYNNMFQNIGMTGIFFNVPFLMNARLSLSAPVSSLGNKFWHNNFNPGPYWGGNWTPFGIIAYRPYEFDIQCATFRGLAGPWGGSGTAIDLTTSRFNNYNIRFNNFSNVPIGISLNAISCRNSLGTYPTISPYIYAGSLDINGNFFSPQVNSSTPNLPTEELGTAITIEGLNFAGAWAITGLSGSNVTNASYVQNNIMDRVNYGIEIQEFARYPLGVVNNTIKLNPANSINGISLIGSWAHKTIRGNLISAATTNVLFGGGGTGIFCQDNSSSAVTCNTVVGGHTGFMFAGNNPTEWAGNTMQDNMIGLHLYGGSSFPATPPAFIGTQGSTVMASGNLWTGNSWTTGAFETWIDAPNYAFNNALYINNSPNSIPLNNAGAPGYSTAGPFPSLIVTPTATDYVCPFNWLVERQASTTTDTNIIPDATSQLSLYPNPNNGSFTIETYTDLQELSVSIVDLTGKSFFSGIVPVENYKAKLSLDLINGIYLITARGNDGSRFHKKIAIAK